MAENLEVLLGDCRAILPTLEAGSVQCCITSPPYWGLRDYGVDGALGLEPTPEEYIENMVAVFREVWRVLRDDGTCWINLGDSYNANQGNGFDTHEKIEIRSTETREKSKARNAANASPKKSSGLKPKNLVGIPWRLALALQADGWYLRSDIIWAKPNPMPESVTDRPTKAHEYIFLLTKVERYFYDAEAIREPHARLWDASNGGSLGPNGGKKMPLGKDDPNFRNGHSQWERDHYPEPNPAGRNKRSVWTIAEPEHVAQCPIDPAIVAALQADGWEIRVEPKPETVDRPTHSHEYIFLLTKSAKYFYDAEAIREPATEPRRQSSFRGGSYCDHSSFNNSDKGITKTPLHSFNLEPRNKRTVWTIATQPYAEAHFATFPEEIPKLCILAGSKPGDTILDPFGGSGTVAKVALELGRRAVLIELNPDYIELAQDRTFVTPGFF